MSFFLTNSRSLSVSREHSYQKRDGPFTTIHLSYALLVRTFPPSASITFIEKVVTTEPVIF